MCRDASELEGRKKHRSVGLFVAVPNQGTFRLAKNGVVDPWSMDLVNEGMC